MARVEIELKDGTKKIVELDDNFTDADIEEISNQLNSGIKDNTNNETQKGIDLTPSGLIDNTANAIVSAIETPYRMVKDKQNPKDAFKSAYNVGKKARKSFEQEHPVLSGVRGLATDLYGYSLLPNKGGFLGQATIQGGVPFALESLKRGQNPLTGLAGGTAIGVGIQGLPYVGKVIGGANKLGLRGVGKLAQMKPETVEQAIKPESKALDLTKEEADRLALDTTERFRKEYQNLKNKLGNNVNDEVLKLSELENQVPVENLKQDVADVFNAEQLGKTNWARDMEGATEQELYNMINNIAPEGTTSLDPIDLVGIKRQVGKKINWDNTEAYNKNQLLKKVYNKLNKRINDLSPEVQKANSEYAKVRNLLDEKSRLRSILNPKADIETATSKLKNYKTTNDDIYALENRFINEGAEPFLSDIDDVNSALDILKNEKTGLGGVSEIAKTILTKPILRGVRALNRSQIPQNYQNFVNNLRPLAQKLLTPFVSRSVAPMMLQGGISNTTDDYGYGY